MDFKVCGTRKGITSIQMGIKTSGRTTKIMRRALDQARVGRLHILDELLKPLAEIPHGSASSRRESPPS